MKHEIAVCAEHAGAKLWQGRSLKRWSLSKDLVLIKATLLCRKMEAPLVDVDMHLRWLNHSDLNITQMGSCVNNCSEQNIEQRVSWLNKGAMTTSTVYSPPENIPHSTAEAYKVLKWLVFIGANNIRCFYLRHRSEAMMVVSSPRTHLKIYIYIYV